MLKYFNTGVDRSEWMEQRRNNKISSDCDSAKLFNYEEFLNKYSGGLQTNDSESWSFLRYFTSMPLFKRLVERCVLQQDHLELQVFISRINELGTKRPAEIIKEEELALRRA